MQGGESYPSNRADNGKTRKGMDRSDIIALLAHDLEISTSEKRGDDDRLERINPPSV